MQFVQRNKHKFEEVIDEVLLHFCCCMRHLDFVRERSLWVVMGRKTVSSDGVSGRRER